MSKRSKNTSKFGHSIPTLLRARRKELQLTLQQLSDKADLSTAFISQAERGLSTPSIMSLMQLSSALDVDVSYFISSPATDTLVHYDNKPVVLDIDSPITYIKIDSDIKNQQLTSLMMVIPPKYVYPTPIHREGEELIYVLDGHVILQLEDESFSLRQGDSAHFNSQTNHGLSNTSTEPAKVLWVGTPEILHIEQQ